MKTMTKQKCTAILFTLTIFLILGSMLFHGSSIGAEFLTTYRSTVLPGTPTLDRVKGAIRSLDSTVNAGIIGRPEFVELYGLAQRSMNKKIIPDPNYGALYKTVPYGQITFAVGEKYLPTQLDKTYDLVNTLISYDIPFLYVQGPFKLPPDSNQLPLTVSDYSNKNADEFLYWLEAAKVNCMDLRPAFWGSGMTQNELFFDTDHHWTIDAAFYSTGLIVKELNANYGFTIDWKYFDIGNFNRETYEDFYLGSMGRRVGRFYGGLDDFTLITPNFETSYTLIEDGSKTYEGSFEDAILVKSYLDKDKLLDPQLGNRYAVYHGDNAELIFKNHMVDKGKILLIKDSFGIPVYSFMSLGVEELRAIDVRLFKGDVAEYAKAYNPDIVIMLYNGDSFSDVMFDFKEKQGGSK